MFRSLWQGQPSLAEIKSDRRLLLWNVLGFLAIVIPMVSFLVARADPNNVQGEVEDDDSWFKKWYNNQPLNNNYNKDWENERSDSAWWCTYDICQGHLSILLIGMGCGLIFPPPVTLLQMLYHRARWLGSAGSRSRGKPTWRNCFCLLVDVDHVRFVLHVWEQSASQ